MKPKKKRITGKVIGMRIEEAASEVTDELPHNIKKLLNRKSSRKDVLFPTYNPLSKSLGSGSLNNLLSNLKTEQQQLKVNFKGLRGRVVFGGPQVAVEARRSSLE